MRYINLRLLTYLLTFIGLHACLIAYCCRRYCMCDELTTVTIYNEEVREPWQRHGLIIYVCEFIRHYGR